MSYKSTKAALKKQGIDLNSPAAQELLAAEKANDASYAQTGQPSKYSSSSRPEAPKAPGDRARQELYNRGGITLSEMASQRQQELYGRPTAAEPEKKDKGFLLDSLSTVTGIAGGVVGSTLGPAGTIAGAGVGAALGEMVENIAMGEPLVTNVPQTMAIDAALVGAGIGLLRVLKPVSKIAFSGKSLIATKGLTNPAVAKSASGLFAKTTKLGTPISWREGVAGSKLVTKTKIPINTVYSNKVIQLISQATAGKKFKLLLTGLIGNTVMNGFLDEESLQNLSFETEKLFNAGNEEAAFELLDMQDEIYDLDVWQAIGWLIPGTGPYKYIKTGGVKASMQRRRFEKKLQEKTETASQKEDFLATGELSPELEPKWRDNPDKPGKVLPNEDNPNWVKKGGKLVWVGE